MGIEMSHLHARGLDFSHLGYDFGDQFVGIVSTQQSARAATAEMRE